MQRMASHGAAESAGHLLVEGPLVGEVGQRIHQRVRLAPVKREKPEHLCVRVSACMRTAEPRTRC